MIKAIIFDFDGVIHDTYELNFKVNNHVLNGMSRKEHKDLFNGNIFDAPEVDSDSERNFTEMQNKEFEGLVIEKHIKEELDMLKEIYDLFIVTSNNDVAIKGYIKDNLLEEIFTEVLSAEVHKSKEEKFNMIFKKYGLSKDECIFVTDTLGDILEANKVGIKTIAVDFGYHERERLEKGNPFAIVSDFRDIKPIVEKL